MAKRKNAPGAGRPRILKGGDRFNLYLSDEYIAIALEIGKGNKSDGVRLALEIEKKNLKI